MSNQKHRRIREIFILALLFVFASTSLFSQQTTPDSTKSCLWRIQNPQNTVYLLGSVHLLKKENYPLRNIMLKAFEEAQTLIFELNLDSVETPAAQQMMLMKGLFTDDQTLKGCMNEKIYAEVARISQELGLNIAQMDKFKPWFFTLTLMAIKLQKLGFDQNLGIDKYFYQKAKQAKKKVDGLETIKFQIELFEALSEKHREELILQTIKEFDVIEQEMDKLLRAWQAGDTAALEQLMFQSFQDYPQLRQQFIVQRNMNWLPAIENCCQQTENYLVIVGTGHLIGQTGLINLLREKGYLIEQL